MRWDESVLERLQRKARASGSSASALAQRYVDEALRMSEHPGITFRDGPAGRRAGLAGGPDVWEIVQLVQQADHRGEQALHEAAEASSLVTDRVRIAVRYYAAFPAEVDEMIAENVRVSDEAYAAWQAEQRLLA